MPLLLKLFSKIVKEGSLTSFWSLQKIDDATLKKIVEFWKLSSELNCNSKVALSVEVFGPES